MPTYRSIRALALTLPLASCASLDVGPASSSPSATGSEVADVAALHLLASVRCSREASCDNIGPGEPFTSRGECFDETRQLGLRALESAGCGETLEKGPVTECALELRNKSCFVSIADLGRLQACRPDRLCWTASQKPSRQVALEAQNISPTAK